jgi:hypothetical protein
VSKYDSGLFTLLTGTSLSAALGEEGADAAAADLSDVAAALELTSEIVLLEMIHRVIVCVYETICLFRGPRGMVTFTTKAL